MSEVVFKWPYEGRHVNIAGTFTRWNQVEMYKRSKKFEIPLDVPDGDHQYKFVVDGSWCYDILQPNCDDCHGGRNNYIHIASTSPKIESQQKKNQQTQPQKNQQTQPQKNQQTQLPKSKQQQQPLPVSNEEEEDQDPDLEKRFDLVRSVGEECVTEPEMWNLLKKKPNFRLYDGFEPSGRMHIAQGVFKAMNVNKCTQSGGIFIFWVADWFALMNDKMGGDLEKIKTVGKYLIEVWKAVGMSMENVQFLWSSEEITKHASKYWMKGLDIARRFTVARVTKCCQIMGRAENNLTAAQILYPIMQCTDIFFLQADICQLGVDQRKVNMLARDYCDAAGIKLKPIILSHHMLYGLKKGQAKMSKSDPLSAIFMEDTDDEVRKKIGLAYCPLKPEEGVAESAGEEGMRLVEDELMNPCLDYLQHIIFSVPGASFSVGKKRFNDFTSVKEAFLSEKISENELKDSLAEALIKLIRPVREHFEQDPEARDLLQKILTYKKETQTVTTKLRHVQLDTGGSPHVVFAPIADAQFELGTVLDVLNQLQSAPSSSSQVLLWLPDWSSYTLNCLEGDQKSIKSSYTLLIEGLRGIAPEFMSQVRIEFQSDVILTDPSNYWISVINVGRKFPLSRVRQVDEENPQVAQVISSLMHVGDVLATGAVTIGSGPNGVGLHNLAIDYYKEAGVTTLPTPKLIVIPPVNVRLQRVSEGPDNPDQLIFPFLDAQADVSRKLKKAFCEPMNVDFCPPLVLTQEVAIRFQGSLTVKRKPENGGDKIYTTTEEVKEDFAKGDLHPNDLKPSVGKQINDLLDKVRDQFKKEAGKKAVVDIKGYLKKAATEKKKK